MRIAVIGCGMGGMASAIQLTRSGHQVSVFEAFASARPLGAGLLLQPTGLEALAQLGLRDRITEQGAEIDALVGRSPEGRLVMDLRYGYGRAEDVGIGIHRATLFNVLFGALQHSGADIVTGSRIESINDTAAPRLTCTTGETDEFDAVIISDGTHSQLRAQICPQAKSPVYPWGAAWTIRPDPDGRWHRNRVLAQIYAGTRVMIGVLPVGNNPASPESGKCISLFWSLEGRHFESWRKAGLESFRDQLRAHWPEADALMDGVTSLDEFATATYRDVRCRRWSKDKVILIGDAAHGASPQLGQGANMAICDGLAIANELALDAPSRAFVSFERKRRPTIRFYTWMSWALTPIFQGHADWLGRLRNLCFGFFCRLPGTRNLMTWTLTGRGRWFW
jgi:2-polyprenyl-6-methoxyphenol hydroxylase-like FAD-dependent oxidoreductase